jgi:hypothetical protein
MAVTSHIYPLAIKAIAAKTIDMTDSSHFFAGLCTGDASTWGATQEAYQYVSDVTGAYTECSDSDYLAAGSSGRITLVTLTLTQSGSKIIWKCTSPAPISWGSSVTITARSMFIYTDQVGSGDSSYPVIAIVDFGADVDSTAGTWEYTEDGTNGLAYFTSS